MLKVFCAALLLLALLPATPAAAVSAPVEPQAGTWQTWILSTPNQFRPGPPPDDGRTQAELDQLRALADQRDAAALSQVAFWDTGALSYRWNELALTEALKHNLSSNYGTRALALLHVALSDAMVATWDAKYAYQRARPSDADASLVTVVATPSSPSYPSEHAAAAGAAATVLTYLFPDDAGLFAAKADAANRSRLMAGVQYPSDMAAGSELGRSIGALVVDWAKQDGSDAQWSGSVPTQPGHWNGTNPILPMAGTWKTWALSSGSEFRPGPPPAYDSPEETADLAVLKDFQRTPKTNSDAFFWEYASGGTRNFSFWNEQANKKILEYRLDSDPPLAARAYAVEAIAVYDAGVACWDAKYTYWAIRPFQLDPTFSTLFPTPNHPSYPAAHGCFSSVTPPGGCVSVSAVCSDGELRVAAKDTGVGIAPEDQARIFDEFHQVARNGTGPDEGTGLGLALSRRLVELHGGRIWVESDVGRGSTFVFALPLA